MSTQNNSLLNKILTSVDNSNAEQTALLVAIHRWKLENKIYGHGFLYIGKINRLIDKYNQKFNDNMKKLPEIKCIKNNEIEK